MRIQTAEFVKSVVNPELLPDDGLPQIAFLGRSNVGKSSLINSLTQQKGLSRTSSTPGRTQMVNLFKINRAFYLVDLPGYGYAKASVKNKQEFQNLIRGYLDAATRLVLAVVIIDARIGPTPLDIQILMHMEEKGTPFLVIANKIDKLSKAERKKMTTEIQDALPGATVLPHSAETTEGRGEILEAIQKACKT